jgi:tellurite resistance protein TehA-like permease
MRYKGLDSTWFPVVLGTLSISLAFFIIYLVFHSELLFDIGKIIYFIVLIFFAFVFASWIYRYVKNKRLIMEDYNDITKLSFLAFLGVLYFAFAFFYTAYVGINPFVAYLFYYLFIFFYVFVLVINVVLNYNLYTNKYSFDRVTYAILVPNIVLSANIILTSVMLTPPMSDYYSIGILRAVYFMVMVAFGISFFQFLFVGISAYISHISNRPNYLQTSPAAMIPVGASSMLIINIMFMPQFNYIGIFHVAPDLAVNISIMLWGFDLFLFLVSGAIAVMHIKQKQSMTVWAYVFPVGISTFSDYMIYIYTKLNIFVYSVIIFTVALIILYIYAWINTYTITGKPLKK